MYQADVGDINAKSYELHVPACLKPRSRQPGFFIFISGGIPFISVTMQFCQVGAEYFTQQWLSHYP